MGIAYVESNNYCTGICTPPIAPTVYAGDRIWRCCE
jgi:hypothetical protein